MFVFDQGIFSQSYEAAFGKPKPPQVKIEDVVYRLEGEFRKALADVYHLINGPDVSVSLRNISRKLA